jgi:deoxyribodipyrimidine photo-lyase
MAAPPPIIVWFRRDLRLDDNPALAAAVALAEREGRPLLTLYVLDETPGLRPLGGAGRWWLHGSLAALAGEIAQRGGRLVLRRGVAESLIEQAVVTLGADTVFANSRPEPDIRGRDRALLERLKARGVGLRFSADATLWRAGDLVTRAGAPFKVFTPFFRAALALPPPPLPVAAPARLPPPPDGVGSDALGDWDLLPTRPDWAGGLRRTWIPGEPAARRALERFIDERLAGYAGRRDRPDLAATSRLSPHLAQGELSPRRLWHAIEFQRAPHPADAAKFLAELGWREFSYHLLIHFPALVGDNLRPEFDRFPWRDAAADLHRWQRGRTGFPIVDAGMRELRETGWLHNRVRMIVASFLVKHLRIHWRWGEAWFWDNLVDADQANNAASWQWVAGTGCDAAPYFRIFNPLLQGERFDPDGAYVARWRPPGGYVPPMLDLKAGRAAALAAFATLDQ